MALVATPAAQAATRESAQVAARKSANAYTNRHYGIGFAGSRGWRHWHAGCTRSRPGWVCTVTMNGGQCMGSVELTAGLRGYAHRISCGE
jgi:hypothetical protein